MFKLFTEKVQQQLKQMQKDGKLFTIKATKNEVWELYLASFPKGSSHIYKERNEYDCNVCKNFIRDVGNAVIIKNGKLETIWNIKIDDPTYQTVCNALNSFVKSQPIANIYSNTQIQVGAAKTIQQLEGTDIKI